MSKIILSILPKTWILDLDGTLAVHNGHILDGDKVLKGVKEFYEKLGLDDKVLIITARKKEYKLETIKFLKDNNIRYDDILFEYPVGERILINDEKPSGLKMAYAVNKIRDREFNIDYEIKRDSNFSYPKHLFVDDNRKYVRKSLKEYILKFLIYL